MPPHHRGGWQSATFCERPCSQCSSICSALARSSSEALAIARLLLDPEEIAEAAVKELGP
jgi:hypothetical protein